MNREDIIRLFTEANGWSPKGFENTLDDLERFAALVAAAAKAEEREAFPDLTAVINWLENGCDPKEAAKELRLYAAAIRARGQA